MLDSRGKGLLSARWNGCDPPYDQDRFLDDVQVLEDERMCSLAFTGIKDVDGGLCAKGARGEAEMLLKLCQMNNQTNSWLALGGYSGYAFVDD